MTVGTLDNLSRDKTIGIIKAIKRIWHAYKTKEFRNSDIADLKLEGKKGMLEDNVNRFLDFVSKYGNN